jgi:predicted transcriptional regulator
MPTFSTQVQYSERLKELELAINTLSDDTQNLGRIYIINNDNRNKKFILSIIEFLKETGWLVQDENGKNIHSTQQTNTTSNVEPG